MIVDLFCLWLCALGTADELARMAAASSQPIARRIPMPFTYLQPFAAVTECVEELPTGLVQAIGA